LHNDVVLQ
jgi:hypothetical protein